MGIGKENGLLWLINKERYEDAETLINDSLKDKTLLEINEKDEQGYYPLLLLVYKNNIELTKLLMKYADENDLVLELNSKDNGNFYPLLVSIDNREVVNNEMTELLIEYANKHNIKLEINEKNSNESYPILNSITSCNHELTKMLIEYANDNDIILDLDEEDIDNAIKDKIFEINSYSEIDNDIYQLLYKNHKKNTINIKFSDCSVFLKRFNELSDEAPEKNNDIANSVIVTTKENNVNKMESLIKFADENNLILKINEKDKNNCSPILWTIYQRNKEMMTLLFEYAERNNIVLEIESQPLDLCIKRNYLEMTTLLTEYATRHHIVLNITSTLISEICSSESHMEIAKILFEYASNNNIMLNINENDYNGNYPLLETTYYNNIEMMKLLMDYADKNNFVLKLNEKTYDGDYPLFNLIDRNYVEMTKVLLNYASQHNITLNIKEKGFDGDFITQKSINNNHVEMSKLLINYANYNNIILGIHERDLIQISDMDKEIIKLLYKCQKRDENNVKFSSNEESVLSDRFKEVEEEVLMEEKYFTSFLEAIKENSIENMNSAIYRANEHNITIDMSEKDKDGNYPLCMCVNENSVEMTKILLNYANEHHIILHLNEKDIKNVSNINDEIAFLLYLNKNENKLFITCSHTKSELAKLFEKISIFISMEIVASDKVGDVALVLYDFNGSQPIELNIRKDEYLIVTSWNFKEGWAFGYKSNKPSEEGIFPVPLVSKCTFNRSLIYPSSHQNSLPLPEINIDPFHLSNFNTSFTYGHPYPFPMFLNHQPSPVPVSSQSPMSPHLPISPELPPPMSPHLPMSPPPPLPMSPELPILSQSPMSQQLPMSPELPMLSQSPMSPPPLPVSSHLLSPVLPYQPLPMPMNENINTEKINVNQEQSCKPYPPSNEPSYPETSIPYDLYEPFEEPSEHPYPPSKLPYPPRRSIASEE
jgi:ankyrin repeat protein